MNYSKKTDRLDIYIDDALKTITIRQRWEYRWKNEGSARPWTDGEKKVFQEQASLLITSSWEDAHKVNVEGKSSFAKQNVNQGFQFRFDIQQSVASATLGHPHWVVNIIKSSHNNFAKSQVNWPNREVRLDIADINAERKLDKFPKIYQIPVAHEFGHMIGNTPWSYPGSHGDEYKLTTTVQEAFLGVSTNLGFYRDQESLMNKGSALRERHFDYLIRELNTIIPDTKFYFRSVLLWR
jgi:hypothetical protein